MLSVLCLLGVEIGCRRAAAPPPPPLVPQVSGEIAVAGLTAPVRVVRDTWGVPHIYAQNDRDLFFAQGFVQAQDRLFQMDLWRRAAQGRLSEVLGPNFIERDAMTRRMQYRGDPAAEWASYGPDANAIAEAFVRGVNAWVALARERPPEEFVLAGWKPEPWSAADLLNRTEAFSASGDALDEVFRSRLIATVGPARARLLLAEDRPLDPAPGVDPAVVPALAAEMIRRVGTPPFFLGLAAPVMEGTVRLKADITDTQSARRLDHPSLRYFVHLVAPGWNVIGATSPWRPGVAEGHNDRIGWTLAPLAADTQDLYVEKLNPANASISTSASISSPCAGARRPWTTRPRPRGTGSSWRPISSVIWRSPCAGLAVSPERPRSSPHRLSIAPRRTPNSVTHSRTGRCRCAESRTSMPIAKRP
jgi:hypothetical protein